MSKWVDDDGGVGWGGKLVGGGATAALAGWRWRRQGCARLVGAHAQSKSLDKPADKRT